MESVVDGSAGNVTSFFVLMSVLIYGSGHTGSFL